MVLDDKVRDRYSRQVILSQLGEEGQERLLASKVAVIGMGALGGNIANMLARAGVGQIRLIDRDIVELNNLQRQTLFDEEDIGKPKAKTAAGKLALVNSNINIEFRVVDVNHSNIEGLISGFDIVLDGTDNLETRFLINDVCVKLGIPWVYGGAVETKGMAMAVVPEEGPCFRCLLPEMPGAGSTATCDTVGVINTIPNAVASLQVTEAIKYISGQKYKSGLVILDIWERTFDLIEIERNPNCRTCGRHDYEFLNADADELVTIICGANAIQITPLASGRIDLNEMAERLAVIGKVEKGEIILKFWIDDYELRLFTDGRLMVQGTNDASTARSLYARYIGN